MQGNVVLTAHLMVKCPNGHWSHIFTTSWKSWVIFLQDSCMQHLYFFLSFVSSFLHQKIRMLNGWLS